MFPLYQKLRRLRISSDWISNLALAHRQTRLGKTTSPSSKRHLLGAGSAFWELWSMVVAKYAGTCSVS